MEGRVGADTTVSAEAPPDILDTEHAGGAVIRGGALRVAGYLATVLASVGSSALLTRYLGPGDFGRYTTALSLTTIVAALTEAGLTNLGVREYSAGEADERRRIVATVLGARLVLTVISGAVAILFALIAGYDATIVGGVTIGAVALVPSGVQASLTVPLLSSLRLGAVSALELVRQGVQVGLQAALVVAGASLFALLAVPLPAAIAFLAATIMVVRGKVSMRPTFDRAELRRLARLALPYTATTAVGVIYAYITVVLLSLTTTQAETGWFGAAFRVFAVLTAIPGLLINSAFPVLAHAARRDSERLAYALQRMFDVTVIAGLWMSMVTAIGAPVAIAVVAGSDFDPSIAALRIQAFALLGTYFAASWGFALLALDRMRAVLVANALALATSVGLTLALAGPIGARGAAVANVGGEAVLGGAYAFALLRARPDLRVSIGVVWPSLLASAAAAATLLVPIGAVAQAVLATLLFGAVLVVFRAIPPEIAEALRSRRPDHL
jgi:O-antigen/teichoic acid export membrane protein